MTLETAESILIAVCKRARVETHLTNVWMGEGGVICAAIYTLREDPRDLAKPLEKRGLQVNSIATVDRDTYRYEMVVSQ